MTCTESRPAHNVPARMPSCVLLCPTLCSPAGAYGFQLVAQFAEEEAAAAASQSPTPLPCEAQPRACCSSPQGRPSAEPASNIVTYTSTRGGPHSHTLGASAATTTTATATTDSSVPHASSGAGGPLLHVPKFLYARLQAGLRAHATAVSALAQLLSRPSTNWPGGARGAA